MLGRWGRWVALHPWRVLVVWVLLVAACAGGALGAFGNEGVFDRLASGSSQVPGESRDGTRLVDARTPPTRQVLLQVDDLDVASARAQSALGQAVTTLRATRGVIAVAAPVIAVAAPVTAVAAPVTATGTTTTGTDPTTTGTDPTTTAAAAAAARALTSPDGRHALVTATVRGASGEAASDAALARARAGVVRAGQSVTAAVPGSHARVGGVDDLVSDINGQVQDDLETGEAAALPLSLLVMVLVFGGFMAAGIPILGALATIAGGLAALLGFSHVTDLDSSVVNVVTILGLGLCIDYGLLVVSRYREELRVVAETGLGDRRVAGAHRAQRRAGPDRASRTLALERTMASAGRTVTFSAVTVAISLAGLLVFGAPVLRSMGLASVSVVVLALLVALSLVPALLAAGGSRLAGPGALTRVRVLTPLTRRLSDVSPETGSFSALALRVQRRPALVLVAISVLLALVAVPAAGLALRSDGVELLPAGNPSREFFTDLDARFPAATAPAVTVVARATPAQVADYARTVADTPGVTSVQAPTKVGDDLVTLGVRTRGDSGSDSAQAVVTALRADDPGFRTWVTGGAADVVDFEDDLVARAPWAAGMVVVATFALLFLLTGSVLVPLKALAVNVLSLGACLGVTVWIFQDGHLQGLLGYTSTGGIETFVPPLVVAFGFGLAMDYEVFLLARILEARRAGARTDAAVVVGLQQSGRIITSAALIVVIVFAGFAAGDLLAIKEVGLGLAVAVSVDATLVRMLLVPAVMTLLGELNWWAPAPLRRLHDKIGLRE